MLKPGNQEAQKSKIWKKTTMVNHLLRATPGTLTAVAGVKFSLHWFYLIGFVVYLTCSPEVLSRWAWPKTLVLQLCHTVTGGIYSFLCLACSVTELPIMKKNTSCLMQHMWPGSLGPSSSYKRETRKKREIKEQFLPKPDTSGPSSLNTKKASGNRKWWCWLN